MKKFLSILLISLLVLTGCSKKEAPEVGNRIGLGVTVSESYDEKELVYESNTTYAAVVMAGDKIEYVHIDTAQNSFTVGDKAENFAGRGTKREQGENYGMVAYGGSDLEWFEQVEAIEKFMVGKTMKEIEAGIKGDADISSKVSIYIDVYVDAVKDAVRNTVLIEDIDKVTVGSLSSLKAADFQINTDIILIAIDTEGKVVFSTLDAAQTSASVEGGKVAVGGNTKTKKQLGPDYGMTKNPTAVAEWDKQAISFTKFMSGQTIDEILGMPTYSRDDAHPRVPDVEDLKSTVTIDVGGFLDLIEHLKDSFVSFKK